MFWADTVLIPGPFTCPLTSCYNPTLVSPMNFRDDCEILSEWGLRLLAFPVLSDDAVFDCYCTPVGHNY